MTEGAVAAEGVELGGAVLLEAETYLHHGEEVETDGADALSGGAHAQLPVQAIVRLVVKVKVRTHNGEASRRLDILAAGTVLVVADEHQGIVVDGSTAGEIISSHSGNLVGIDWLSVAKRAACASRRKGGSWLIVVVLEVHPVVIVVAVTQINGLAPMSGDGDTGNTIGHIVVAALGEGALRVLVGTVAVGEVVAILPVLDKGDFGAIPGVGDVPAGHDIFGVVAAVLGRPVSPVGVAEHGIVVGQLYLAVAVVGMQGVHVGDGDVKARGTRTVRTGIDGDMQRAQILAFPLVGRRAPGGIGVDIDGRRVVAKGLQHGIGSHGGVEHPLSHERGILGHGLHFGCRHRGRSRWRPHPPAAQLAVAVELAAVELVAGEVVELCGPRAVVASEGAGELAAHAVVVVVVDGIGTRVVNLHPAIDGIDGRSADVPVEHAVHHGGAQVGILAIGDGGIAGDGVSSHDACGDAGGADIGIAEAVDDARVILQGAHDASGIAASAHAGVDAFGEGGIIWQDAAVVDAAVALGDTGNGSHALVAAADADAAEHDVPHHAAVDSLEERMREAADGVAAAVEGAGEIGCDGLASTDVCHEFIMILFSPSGIDRSHKCAELFVVTYQIRAFCCSITSQIFTDILCGNS